MPARNRNQNEVAWDRHIATARGDLAALGSPWKKAQELGGLEYSV